MSADELVKDLVEGQLYSVELDGQVVERFEAPRSVRVVIVPRGQASVFLLEDGPDAVPAAPRPSTSWVDTLNLWDGAHLIRYPDAVLHVQTSTP